MKPRNPRPSASARPRPYLALFLSLGCAAPLGAATYTEVNNPGNFTWNAAPWSAGIPNGVDNGLFSSGSGLMRGDGTITIDGMSTGTTPNSLMVGWQGNSTLHITGGTLAVGDFNTEGFAIGESGNGTVNQDAGTVTAAAVRFARGSGTGVYNLNGGTLAAGLLAMGNGTSGTLNFDGGTLRATAGGGGWFGANIATRVEAGGATIDTQAFDVTVNSAILDDGTASNGGLRLVGSGLNGGVLRLNVASTYTGDTNIDAGYFVTNVSGALPGTSVVRLNNVGGAISRIELFSTSQTISGLTSGAVAGTGIGTTDVYASSPGSSLQIQTAANQTYAFLGTVGNNGGTGASDLTLTKTGDGTQIIANPLYTGLTTISGGTLQVGNNDANGSVGVGGYAVGAAGELVFSRNVDNALFSNQSISGSGDVVFRGQANGYFTLREGQYTGTLSNSGTTTVDYDAANGGTTWYQRALWLEKDNVFSNTSVLDIQSGKVILRNQTGTGLVTAGLSGNAGTFLTTERGEIQKVTVNTAGGSFTYDGVIGMDTFAGTPTNDNLSLTKTGDGTQILTGANTYAGGTTVTDGTLLANNASGSATGSGTVNVAGGATFGGTGSISGLVTTAANAELSPGGDDAIESLGVGAVSGAGTLFLEYDGAAVLQIDQLIVANDFAIGFAVLDFGAIGSLSPLMDPAYVLVDYGSLTGSQFASVNNLPAGYDLDYHYQSANQIALVQVPEPGTAVILAVGLAGLVLRRRRRA